MTEDQIRHLESLKNELHLQNCNNDPDASPLTVEEVSRQLEELINVLLDNEV